MSASDMVESCTLPTKLKIELLELSLEPSVLLPSLDGSGDVAWDNLT